MISEDRSNAIAVASHGVTGTRLRICFVSDTCLPLVGGAELLTVREAHALHGMGCTVGITTLRLKSAWPSTELIEGLTFRRTGGIFLRGKLRLRFGAQWVAEAALFWELVRTRASYDVVHMRQLTFLARPVALASIVTGKPVIVQLASAGPGKNSPVPPGGETRLYAGSLDPEATYLRIPARSWGASDIERLHRWQWLAGLTLRLLRRRNVTILAVSQRMRTGLLEEGFRDEQIALVPTGIETDVYAEAFSQGEARASAEIKARTVLCVAKYRYEKGLDILLHAWTMVQKRVPEARLLLIGGGQLEAQLRAMIEDLGLTESVDLAGQSRDVPALLGQVDVFVLPSRYEGMSNALLEAMAAGLPCVATEVSGNEDNIVPDESGLLVPPGNPEALAEALITVLTQPAKARELGRAARNRALYHYDRKILMPQLIDLYTKCIAAASSARKSQVATVQVQQTSLNYRLEPVVDEEAANR